MCNLITKEDGSHEIVECADTFVLEIDTDSGLAKLVSDMKPLVIEKFDVDGRIVEQTYSDGKTYFYTYHPYGVKRVDQDGQVCFEQIIGGESVWCNY